MGREEFPRPPEPEARTEKQADIFDLTQQIETVRTEKFEAIRHIARLNDELKEVNSRLGSLEMEEKDLVLKREDRLAQKE